MSQRTVSGLTLEDYQEIMDSIADKSYSLQQKLRQLISQLCQYAAIRKIENVNYAPFLILDGYRSESREIFSDEEIARLYFYANSGQTLSRDAAITLILIFTGLRPEELFEIKKEDINFEHLYFVAKGSKTAAGRDRLIPIVSVILPYIRNFWMLNRDSPYLITSVQGCRIDLHNWRHRKFLPLMQELGINKPDAPKRIVPYCTRHTYASLADRAGVDHETLAKLIGHTSYKLTKEVYIHERLDQFTRETDKVAALVAAFLAGSKPAA